MYNRNYNNRNYNYNINCDRTNYINYVEEYPKEEFINFTGNEDKYNSDNSIYYIYNSELIYFKYLIVFQSVIIKFNYV